MNSDRVTSISTGDLSVAGAGNKFLKKKIMIVARRGYGAPGMIDALLGTLDREPGDRLLIVSPTEMMSPFYTEKNYPRCSIRYDAGDLSEILAEQRDPTTRSSIIILDNCLDSTNRLGAQNLAYLLGDENSDDLTLIVHFGRMPAIGPETRAMFDYMLLGTEEVVSQRERLYALVPHDIPDFGTFQDRMSALPDYDYLMVDVKGRGPLTPRVEGIGTEMRRGDLHAVGFRGGQHTLIINPDDGSNRNVVHDILSRLAPDLDDVIVVNRYGRNNYGPFVATVHDPTDSTVDDVFHYLLAPENRARKKLLVLEHSFRTLYRKLDEIILNGRHHNITVIVVERYVPAFPPDVRASFDRILVGRYWDSPSLRRLHELYLGVLPERSQLQDLMTHVGGNQLILVDNMVRTGRIHDILSLTTVGVVMSSGSRVQYPGTVPRHITGESVGAS